jgi:hypothetical protein
MRQRKFTNGWKHMKAGGCIFGAAIVCNVLVKQQIDQHVWDKQRFSIDDISSEMSISLGKRLCQNCFRPS